MSDQYNVHWGEASAADLLVVKFAEGRGNNLGKAKNRELPWIKFRKHFETPLRTGIAQADYAKLTKEEKDGHKAAAGWIFGSQVAEGRRTRQNAQPRNLLTLDMDFANALFLDQLHFGANWICQFDFLIHGTRSSTADNPHLRLFAPMSRLVTPDEYVPLSRRVASLIEGGANPITMTDKVSFRPGQMMFKPTASDDQEYFYVHSPGDVLDVDAILAAYRAEIGDPNDLSLMPRTDKEGVLRKPADKAERPSEKPGLVGDFCRAYDVPAAIEAFDLPYTPVDDYSEKPRFTFTAGTSTSGAVLEDGGEFLYSHHGSDPCADMLCNAFDLVRRHKFLDLDDGQPEGSAPGDLPSFRAMVELCRGDEEVRKQRAERIRDLPNDLLTDADVADDDEPTLAELMERLAAIDPEAAALVGWDADTADGKEGKVSGSSAGALLTFRTPAECAAAPSRIYRIKGLVAAGDVAAIVGAPGSGKSTLAPWLAYALAQGRRAFGRRVKPGGVFYVAAEDASGMRARLQALRIEHGEAEPLVLVEGVSDLLTTGSPQLRELRRAVKERQPALVILDTVADCFPGLEENDAASMGRVVAVARSLTKHGAAVILLHHDSKAGDGLPRGHSLLNGALDMVLTLTRDGKVVRGRLRKNRNGSTEHELAFTVETVTLGEDEDGEPVEAAVAREVAAGSLPANGAKLSRAANAALRLLRDTIEFAGEQSITLEAWREACVASDDVSASDNRASRRTAFKRARDELADKGRVGSRDGFYFPTEVTTAADKFSDADVADE